MKSKSLIWCQSCSDNLLLLSVCLFIVVLLCLLVFISVSFIKTTTSTAVWEGKQALYSLGPLVHPLLGAMQTTFITPIHYTCITPIPLPQSRKRTKSNYNSVWYHYLCASSLHTVAVHTVWSTFKSRLSYWSCMIRPNFSSIQHRIKSLERQNVSYFSLFKICYGFCIVKSLSVNIQYYSISIKKSCPTSMPFLWTNIDAGQYSFPTCWILIGQFRFKAQLRYARLCLAKNYVTPTEG